SVRGLPEGDLAFEFGASLTAAPPAEHVEFTLGGGELDGCAVALLGELLLAAGVEARVEIGPGCGLVEGERLGRGALEGVEGAFRRGSRVGVAQGCLALECVVFGEVEAGLAAGAGAGDVAPLLDGALVREQDVGAVDGGALGGVAGERVPVFEVLGRVGGRELPGG